MKNCEEILIEFGIDFLEKKEIPEEIKRHFEICDFCKKEIEKQKYISEILSKETEVLEAPKIEFPPVLRKKDKIPFLFLSFSFFIFFLLYHSILHFELLEPYILIFKNLNLIPYLKIKTELILLLVLILALNLLLLYELKKILKKI